MELTKGELEALRAAALSRKLYDVLYPSESVRPSLIAGGLKQNGWSALPNAVAAAKLMKAVKYTTCDLGGGGGVLRIEASSGRAKAQSKYA